MMCDCNMEMGGLGGHRVVYASGDQKSIRVCLRLMFCTCQGYKLNGVQEYEYRGGS